MAKTLEKTGWVEIEIDKVLDLLMNLWRCSSTKSSLFKR